MDILKTQLHVMRRLAFYRPHAHLAFLFHKPYRAMYDNQGQNIELCEYYGQWIYCEIGDIVVHVIKHSRILYHPIAAFIQRWYDKHVLVSSKGRYWANWCKLYQRVDIDTLECGFMYNTEEAMKHWETLFFKIKRKSTKSVIWNLASYTIWLPKH